MVFSTHNISYAGIWEAALDLSAVSLKNDQRHGGQVWILDCAAPPDQRLARRLAAADRAAKREPAYAAVERAFLSRLPVLRADPHASRCGAVPRTDPPRRRVRRDGAHIDA